MVIASQMNQKKYKWWNGSWELMYIIQNLEYKNRLIYMLMTIHVFCTIVVDTKGSGTSQSLVTCVYSTCIVLQVPSVYL